MTLNTAIHLHSFILYSFIISLSGLKLDVFSLERSEGRDLYYNSNGSLIASVFYNFFVLNGKFSLSELE